MSKGSLPYAKELLPANRKRPIEDVEPAMLALFDADIFVYRIGFTTNGLAENIAAWRLNELIERTLYALNCQDYIMFLSSQDRSENFRYQLFPDYKANRTQPKPEHFQFLRGYLCDKYGATVARGEADDAIGIEAAKDSDRVIVSIDKDLDQLPGRHYNFVKDTHYFISPLEGMRYFYQQCLIGDAVDNIKGCSGIGPVKALRALEGCQNETEMLDKVLRMYHDAHEDDFLDRLWLAGQLLWVRRNPLDINEGWTIDFVPVSKEILLRRWNDIGSRTSTKQSGSSTRFPKGRRRTSRTSPSPSQTTTNST